MYYAQRTVNFKSQGGGLGYLLYESRSGTATAMGVGKRIACLKTLAHDYSVPSFDIIHQHLMPNYKVSTTHGERKFIHVSFHICISTQQNFEQTDQKSIKV